MFGMLRAIGSRLGRELGFLRLVSKDRRTPALAKLLLVLAIGYLCLPFDLIPDWIPLLGHVDDLIIVPLLVVLALKLVPSEVLNECRGKARGSRTPEKASKSRQERLADAVRRRELILRVGLILALVLLVGVPSLFTRDLWNPDEPRYMEVAREMAIGGDYVIPHLNGEVYSEKPPMFFWLAGGLWRLGLGNNSGRVLTIIATLGTLLLVCSTMAKHVGTRAALLSSGAALSTCLLFRFARIGVLDPLLMFFTTWALLLGYSALRKDSRRPGLRWLGCYAMMGCGVLTKGPVGALVPGLILLTYGLINRRNARAGGRAHLFGALALAAVVLAWLAPAMVAGGGAYTRTILLKQNLGRAVNSFDHHNPIYYYLLRAPMDFFPWSLILPFALVAAVSRWRRAGDGMLLFAAVWIIVSIVFFSLISGKRSNYMLPAVPAVAMLVGWYFTSPLDGRRAVRAQRMLLVVAFAILAILSMGLMAIAIAGRTVTRALSAYHVEFGHFMSPQRMAVATVLFALPLGLCVAALARMPQDRMHAAWVLAGAVLLLSLPLDLIVTPAVNKVKSGRTFAAQVTKHAAGSDSVWMYGNGFSGVYNLYTGRMRIPVIERKGEVRELLRTPDVLVITDEKYVADLMGAGAVEANVLHRERVGHREMLLLRGVSPAGTTRRDESPVCFSQVSSHN